MTDSPANDEREDLQNAFSRRRFLQTLGAAAAVSAAPAIANANAKTSEAEKITIPPATPLGEVKNFGPGEVDVKLKINGIVRTLRIEPRVTLLDALRDRLDMTGAKKVCDRGGCGACTIIMNGNLMYSCMLLAVECQGAEIETIEGIAPEGEFSTVSSAFAKCDALQCGFCTPGFVMTITHHLRNEKNPTMESVKQSCRGNLCRCGTYNRIFDAALLAATGGAGLPNTTEKK
ncbi:MAG: (2Fe-2S)-binding protein [Planctomycetes bacterium]|nr:(2Fe-2S)-binding protein [Planctomycetota bacterium]